MPLNLLYSISISNTGNLADVRYALPTKLRPLQCGVWISQFQHDVYPFKMLDCPKYKRAQNAGLEMQGWKMQDRKMLDRKLISFVMSEMNQQRKSVISGSMFN